MSYAIRKDGLGWRAVDSSADCAPDEEYADAQPALIAVHLGNVLSVTMRQARLALLAIGKLDDVEAAINALPNPDRAAARIEWDYAATVEKASPLIQSLAPTIGIDTEALTELFNTAALL